MAVQDTSPSEVKVEAKSSHVEDASLQPFLQPRFDPADYLNATLPSLTMSTASREAQATRATLSELTTRTQSLMSQLSAQTSRLTNTLNQLTDDILRSGSRLAYEVEILRGETVGLSDALNEGLRQDMSHFVVSGNGPSSSSPSSSVQDITSTPSDEKESPSIKNQEQQPSTDNNVSAVAEPEYIEKLRTLTNVRARLESVIQIFGEAMKWPVAPSELSVASSLISVSAPSPARGPEASRDLEEKGKDYSQRLRTEITDLLASAGSTEEGIDAAIKKIDEQRLLASVWKGTAEEKARLRIVEGLMKPVEDEQKALARRNEAKRRTASPSAGIDYRYGDGANSNRQAAAAAAGGGGGYGFIKNLQKLKDDIYLD